MKIVKLLKKARQNKPAYVVIKTTGDNASAMHSLGSQL